MHCYTNFFRGDLPWGDLGKIFHETFEKKPKVNIINSACSDGSESFSIVMALKEAFPRHLWDKFLPIKAFDFNQDLIINAKRGVVAVDDELVAAKSAELRWTMCTPAEARIENNRAIILESKGRKLRVEVLSPNKVKPFIISNDPPHDYDAPNKDSRRVGFTLRLKPHRKVDLQVRLVPQK